MEVEATTDVNESTATLDPGASSELSLQEPQTEPTDTGTEEDVRIPRSRLNEESQKRKEAEGKLAQVQTQQQALMERDMKWQQWYRHQQQGQDPQQGQGPQQATENTVPTEQEIRAQLGHDEAGQQAYDTLEKFFTRGMAQVREHMPTRQDLGHLEQNLERKIMGKIGKANQIGNRFQKWVDNGLAIPEQAGEMQEVLNQQVTTYPQILENPANLDYAQSQIYMAKLEAGDVKPTGKSRPQNVLAAGGNNGSPVPEPDYDPSQSRMSRLRELSPKRAKELRDMSIANHAGAVGQ